MPDARKGEQPLTFVAMAKSATVGKKALLQFVRLKLAGYKVPRQIRFVPTLSRNATGERLKTEKRKIAAA